MEIVGKEQNYSKGTVLTRIFNLGIVVLSLPALTFGALGSTDARAVGILYATSSGTGDCSSWANACSLQTALTGAIVGNELWVAAGIYTPTTGTDRSATFQLKNGVAIYGGFAGTETARVQRDPAAHITILSGDLDDNDEDFSNNAENAHHVVTGATGAILDGFTITAGNANGNHPNNQGGGMFNNINSNPTVTNVTFRSNMAMNYGGGMGNWVSNPVLTNVTFNNNSAAEYGGGMGNSNSTPTMTNVTFDANSSDTFGGGMGNNTSSPTLTNVTFHSNTAAKYGGGMGNLGGSNPALTNVTFSSNSAHEGGGMYNAYISNPQIYNTIFWGNTALDGGAQIYNYENSIPKVSNSVVQSGCPAGSACTNIITTDPLLGSLDNHGGFTQTIPLLAGSSAIDTGNDATCTATDQRGILRPQGAHCDIGAFELVIMRKIGSNINYTDVTAKTVTWGLMGLLN